MKKIKQPSVAGTFYTSNPIELNQQIEMFSKNSYNYEYHSRAVIVPHAGLIYSGQVAYQGINQLKKTLKTLFIIAPSHHTEFFGIALSSFDAWKTPLGEIDLNKSIIAELQEKFGAKIYDEAIANEHSIEIQVPLIQKIFSKVEIVPILIGGENSQKITQIIEFYMKNKDIGFVISSDLSHFLQDSQAEKVDLITAEMIESNDVKDFHPQQACGSVGIKGLVDFAKNKEYSLIRISMTNSSRTTGDKTSVVGYGSWFLYEGEKNSFLKKYYGNLIIETCRESIKSRFSTEKLNLKYPVVFEQKGACFVTLEKQGQLRGCIGSILAHRPLIEDLITNARNSAFSDPRFTPVRKEELSELAIAVSLLSEPQKMSFSSEEDLLSQIKPYEDGIIIKDGYNQAVYLPSVWEQLPDKREFLMSLKMKAGMSAEHFSKTFEASSFHCEYIK